MAKKTTKERPVGRLAPKTGEALKIARQQLRLAEEQVSLAKRIDAMARATDAARLFIKLESLAE